MSRFGEPEGSSVERTNETWIQDLKASDEQREQALRDLSNIIRSGLPYSLSRWLSSSDPHFDALADEVVQETLLRVLDHIDSFEGRSKFTTWAHKIAVRVALTELRRKRWKDVSLDELVDASEAPSHLELLADRSQDPEQAVEQADMLSHIQRIIEEELTDKQRKAMLALGVQGMPIEEVAQRMDMNRNALYKLMHDARIRLKARLQIEGLSPDDILAVFEQP